MDMDRAVLKRYSVRAYLDKPVETEIIKEILQLALQAPSWGNTQPWELAVLNGGPALALAQDLYNAGATGNTGKPDYDMPEEWAGPYLDRYRAVGRDLYHTMGIARDDKQKRMEHSLQNMKGFGASCLIYIILDESLTADYALLDCGIIAAHISLLAVSRGLGTCLQASLARNPDLVRKHIGLPAGKKIALGISIGYPDDDAPENKLSTSRVPIDEIVRWADDTP